MRHLFLGLFPSHPLSSQHNNSNTRNRKKHKDMTKEVDLFIIGGGVNGVAVARDAVGRNLSVALAEKGDIGGETSSKSTKLFHGGLRYLEYFEFKLVRDALIEREILLKNMPHIAWPMRFVLPYHPNQRFEGDTPVSRFLSRIMPWMKGRRPAWLIRFGLFMYDHLGGRKILPATSALNLRSEPEGKPLKDQFQKAYEYSDVWAQDARLVSLMAADAAKRGAMISTRSKVLSAQRENDVWLIETEKENYKARALVNAGGPWVEDIVLGVAKLNLSASVRLVKGSHIVVPKMFDHEKCYFLQGTDGRICFAIPYEQEYTLIGTTDQPHENADTAPECSAEETQYLCDFVNTYFEKSITPEDVIWKFAGVRPLYDDGAKSATAATREYVLTVNDTGAPLINIFGGKITTHRKLAEDVLKNLSPFLDMGTAWTHDAPLTGGNFDPETRAEKICAFQSDHPHLNAQHAERIFSTYGLDAWSIFDGELGEDFGCGLFACEVDHLIANEFATTAEDIIWRRTKLGISMKQKDIARLKKYVSSKRKQSS